MGDMGPGGHDDQSGSLFVLGAGWFAVEVAGWAEDSGWEVAGLVELLDPERAGGDRQGYRVVAVDALVPGSGTIVAGGAQADRPEAWALAGERGCVAPTVVHPTAHLARTATLAPGAIIAPMAVVGAHSSVGHHALLSRGALVGHHATIGDFTRLMPGANVAGHVELADDVTVGMGAAVVDHTCVGARATIAAGAVVLRDVARDTRVQGVPARVFEK